MRYIIGFIAGIATAYAALAIYQALPIRLIAVDEHGNPVELEYDA